MKSNIEKVYSKLPQKKHNFRKQKFELGLVDDLSSTAALFIRAEDTIKSRIEDIRKTKDSLKEYIEIIDGAVKEQQRIIELTKDAAEQLGIDISQLPEFEEQLDFVVDMLNNADELTK